jgi:hypothetical protein
MEGQKTETSLEHFLAGKLRKSVLVDEMFFATLPQFISGKDKVRFKLKNCLVDTVSFVEGDENIHVFFYFKPPVDPNFELNIEYRNGQLVSEGAGKWGNLTELIDLDEELKSWIFELYSGGLIRSSKKISVIPKDNGSRVEISVKKLEKDWRDALAKMNGAPKTVIEDLFNIANRIVSGISNWQGKQIDPWTPTELGKGRPAPVISAPMAPSVPAGAPTLAQVSRAAASKTSTSGSSGFKLPVIPSGEEGETSASSAGSSPTEGPAGAQPVICPMCGVENKPGSLVCFRCQNPL